MKHLIASLIFSCLFVSVVFAECDSTKVAKNIPVKSRMQPMTHSSTGIPYHNHRVIIKPDRKMHYEHAIPAKPCTTSFFQTGRGRIVLCAAALGAGYLIGRANRKTDTKYVAGNCPAECPKPPKKGCKEWR
jgi:hypothetical protein